MKECLNEYQGSILWLSVKKNISRNLTPGASFSNLAMVIRLNHDSVLSASGTLT